MIVCTIVGLSGVGPRGLPLSAHEGHAPLPTKGVQVDTERGHITLSPEAHRALGLQTTPVERRNLKIRALAYATLMTPWQQQHYVSCLLSGRIARLHVTSGDIVQPGQLLAEVASPELDALHLDLSTAVNSLRLSARQVDRIQELVKGQAVAERELAEAIAKQEQDKIAVQVARLKLRSLGIADRAIDSSLTAWAIQSGTERSHNREPHRNSLLIPIISPVVGTVGHRDLSVGKTISAAEHLFEINDLSRLWVKIGVLERDVARIREGQEVELRFSAFPQELITTRLVKGITEVDPVSHVATAWSEIENPNAQVKYLPGMYGTANIVTSNPEPLLSVPPSAVLGSSAERYVLVEVAATSKGSEYRRAPIQFESQSASLVQFRSDTIFPGDRVVKTGGQLLSSFFILGSLRLSKEGLRNVGLKVEPVAQRAVEDVLQFDGQVDLQPGHEAIVSAQTMGILASVKVDRGQRVQAGEVLAEIAGLPFLDTQLSLLRAELELKLLNDTLSRLNAMSQSPLIAARRILETEVARDAALNRRESARQTLLTLGLTPPEIEDVVRTGQTRPTLPVRSPIDGTIVRLNKVLGERVTPEEQLFEIHDLTRPLVRGFLSERDAPKVQIGMPVRLRFLADPNRIVDGRVVRSTRVLGGDNRTLVVWVEFAPDGGSELPQNLRARLFATLRRPVASLAIPNSAVVREQSRNYVFVQNTNGLLERKVVELGRSDDQFVEVLNGLVLDEQIAVQGARELQTTYATVR